MARQMLLIFILLSLEVFAQAPDPARKKTASSVMTKPKLVLAIIVDQFRYDYVYRFESDYTGGFRQLLNSGALFTNARFNHFPTFTSVGHATLLTGAFPSIHGIIGNQWFDRSLAKIVPSASDASVRLLGGSEEVGSSPHHLLVSTVGDELKMSNQGLSRVIGISIKDYSATLATGRMADGAYWFDGGTGNFVSSTYYFPDLPDWVKEYNAKRPADRYRGAEWQGTRLPDTTDSKLYSFIPRTPFGNDLIEEMAEAAILAERLGKRDATDLLFLSFSSNDYVGHQFGPDSPQVRDISIKTDRMLDKLFKFVDRHVGLANVLVVLTADHGVSPTAEANTARRMPGGRVPFAPVQDAIQKALTEKYGEGKWIDGAPEEAIYLNWELIKSKKLTLDEVCREAEQTLLSVPHVFRVYTRERLRNGIPGDDPVGRRLMNSFSARRGADLYIVLEPYYIFGRIAANHGTPFGYDTHVPVFFMGPGIEQGRYHARMDMNDIAPTLATILEIEIPSGSDGRILSEIFADK